MIIPAILLTLLGITVIYSSSPTLAYQQALYVFVGVLLYLGIRKIDFRAIKPLIKPFYFFILLLLIVVFVLGYETRGSLRWIPLGFFNLQPSEFAKIALILVLANFWSRNAPSWFNLLKSVLILAPFWVLVFLQPDLGTALTLGFIWLLMLIGANLSIVKVVILSVIGMLAIPSSWIFLKDYQKQRIISFISPEYDPLGIGYNVIQSTIAVGSGQLWGRGLGRGTQSRLQFLPEYRTDFIFAFLTEELGAIGSLIVLLLYSCVFFVLFKTLSLVNDRFGELIIVGVMGMIFFQMMVNIGMNIGILPVTGITLPFLSYGGSSMVTVFASLGLIASVRKFGLKKDEFQSFSLGHI